MQHIFLYKIFFKPNQQNYFKKTDFNYFNVQFKNVMLMKKLLIILAITSIALTVNAQFFVGGQFGMGIHSESVKSDKSRKPVSLTTNTGKEKGSDTDVSPCSIVFGPRLGYSINDKWAVGGDILFDIGFWSRVRIEDIKDKQKTKEVNSGTTFAWGIYPFARYTFFTYKIFSLGVEGNIGIGSTHEFTKSKNGKEKADKDTGPYEVNLQIFNIKPVMALRLKEHLFLEATLEILGFHYFIDVEPPQKDKNNKSTTTKHNFGLNFNNLTQATLGIVYKF